MKKNNSNSFIKKQLRKQGIHPTRITNAAGVRVWKVGNTEYPSLRAIVIEKEEK